MRRIGLCGIGRVGGFRSLRRRFSIKGIQRRKEWADEKEAEQMESMGLERARERAAGGDKVERCSSFGFIPFVFAFALFLTSETEIPLCVPAMRNLE